MPLKTYNDESKIAAAKLVREQGYSVKQAAKSLGVAPGSLRGWIRKFAAAPAAPATDASVENLQRENLRLRKENRRLLMDREF